MKLLQYPVVFEVEYVTPDPREYNQQRQRFKPVNVTIEVYLDITGENFYLPGAFLEQLKLWELGEAKRPQVPEQLVFTPLGWSRVMELLEQPYEASAYADEDWDEDGNGEFPEEY